MRFLHYLGWWAFVCYTTFQLVQSWSGTDHVARQALFFACTALLMVTDPYRKPRRADQVSGSHDHEEPPVQGDIR